MDRALELMFSNDSHIIVKVSSLSRTMYIGKANMTKIRKLTYGPALKVISI